MRTGDTPKQHRFRMFVHGLLEQGIKPTPTEILKRQGDEKFAHPGSTHRGPTVAFPSIRIEELMRAGWVKDGLGKWRPPLGR